jgi:hypothetical protein
VITSSAFLLPLNAWGERRAEARQEAVREQLLEYWETRNAPQDGVAMANRKHFKPECGKVPLAESDGAAPPSNI